MVYIFTDLSKHNRENDCVGTLAEVCQCFSAAHEEVRACLYYIPLLALFDHIK